MQIISGVLCRVEENRDQKEATRQEMFFEFWNLRAFSPFFFCSGLDGDGMEIYVECSVG